MLSNKLDTLRDMTVDSHIEPSSLTKVRDLGGGAFATGERTWAYWDLVSCSMMQSFLDLKVNCYSPTRQAFLLFARCAW